MDLVKKLKAAKGRIAITPSIGTPIAGNVRFDNKSRGVHDDLYCNILILTDNTTKVCLLGFDLLFLEYSICTDIKNRIEKTTDIPAANIVIWTTHTHSGPDTGMRMYQGIEDSLINAYLEEMTVSVVAGVAKTNEGYEEVLLKSGKTRVIDLSFNRRLIRKDGSVVMNFEDYEVNDITGTTGPIDEELITLSAWDKENKLFALLVNFTLHPAILVGYMWQISRDFVNYLDEYIIENYGNQVVTLFANGAEGNINHLNYQDHNQLRSFEEAERVGKKLGTYIKDSISDASVLNGKIRFISEKVTLPFREITEEEKQWADMVIERDKDLVEDMFDGIPDKTYAKMIKQMLVRSDGECETVLQGMAIHNFAFLTFPGEVYVEYGLKVKELSPYKNTMVIGLANSQAGYIPTKEAFSQGGYEVRTAWISQLVHDAGDILVNLIKEKILGNLQKQSVKVVERKASDNKYLHKDFHIALNLLMIYIYNHFGQDALINYLKQYSRAYYKPLNQKLKVGDIQALVNYFKDIYEKEEWPVKIISGENSVEITQDTCPAISHILQKSGKTCPFYWETYNTVYKTICENTPFEYTLIYFNEHTGACKQLFIRKEVKQ
ncbi:MAG: neutral/alkaline non-lysosomal ceramidase N-terminal domain-containing protein [Bacteroidales bacterium]|nr:neutral/alkaline non-lysosomal ceramidase N-terminal domain-containing protein [Bacteroidales bacterium]